MTLAVDIRLRRGDFELACQLHSEARVVGLFGPSGAGKSSLLYAMAGLTRPDSGRIEINGRCVFDAAARVHVAAHDRRIGFVFQTPRLFPHFNVRHNLTYGCWFGRNRPSRGRLDRVVDMLDIGHLLARRTAGLSGGEAQRVAIGRALLSGPELLLLDEPLASLDGPRKREVLPYIERLSADSALPIVYVSHQLDELLRLAKRHVAVLHGGRIVFSGATADFLARPDLLGAEAAQDAGALIDARVLGHEPEHGLSVLGCPHQRLYVPRLAGQSVGASVTVHIRARDVILARRAPIETSALNQLAGTVTGITHDPDGRAVDVTLDVDGQRLDARITRRSLAHLAPQRGEALYAVIKSLALAEQAWQRLGGL
jgi:molybdate transport system ATP-binding protein